MSAMKITGIFLLAMLVNGSGCVSVNQIHSKTIKAEDILHNIQSKKAVVYTFCTIEGDLDFTKIQAFPFSSTTDLSTIDIPLYFERCTFNGKVSAFKSDNNRITVCRFGNSLGFNNCYFKGEVDFNGATFNSILLLTKSIFNKQVNFQACLFENDVRADETSFSNDLLMQESVIRGVFWAKQATIDGQLSLQRVDFWQNASLAAVSVHKYADMSLANFRRSAFFEYGEYFNTVTFNGAIFNNYAEWNKTKFHQSVDFSNATFLAKPIFNDIALNGELIRDNIKYISGIPDTAQLKKIVPIHIQDKPVP